MKTIRFKNQIPDSLCEDGVFTFDYKSTAYWTRTKEGRCYIYTRSNIRCVKFVKVTRLEIAAELLCFQS